MPIQVSTSMTEKVSPAKLLAEAGKVHDLHDELPTLDCE